MENVIDTYLQKIIHLRSANSYVQDILIINDVLNNFSYGQANATISYIALKYRKDLNTIGRMLTGVMVLDQKDVGLKDEEDLYEDLLYLRDCVVVFGAVHTGIENTIHSAVVKINRQYA